MRYPAAEADLATRPGTRGNAALGLTSRGWTLAGASAALAVGSRVLGAGPLAGLGFAGLLLCGLAAAWVWFQRPGLAMTRRVSPARLHVGSDGHVRLDGTTTTDTPLLTLRDNLVLTLRDDLGAGRRAARFVVPPRPSGATLHCAYRIPTARRGRHVVGPLVATVTDPLGLARRTWPLADAVDVVICPRVHDVVMPRRGGGGEPAAHAEGARAPALEPLGEFLSLRDYESGDDPRRVHWRSSARLGQLLVRQDEAASPGRVVVLLDTRPHVHDERSFETAVEAAASIAVRCRREHAPVEVLSTTTEILARPGPGAVGILLDHLAVVELGEPDHLDVVAATLANRLGLGAVVAITGTVDATLIEALAPLHARCVVTLVATRAAHTGMTPQAFRIVDATSRTFPLAWNASVRQRTPWTAARSRSSSLSAR